MLTTNVDIAILITVLREMALNNNMYEMYIEPKIGTITVALQRRQYRHACAP